MEGLNNFINWYFDLAMTDISNLLNMGNEKYTLIWPLVLCVFYVFKWSFLVSPVTIPIYAIFNGAFSKIGNFVKDILKNKNKNKE